jgi:hypothetical protein
MGSVPEIRIIQRAQPRCPTSRVPAPARAAGGPALQREAIDVHPVEIPQRRSSTSGWNVQFDQFTGESQSAMESHRLVLPTKTILRAGSRQQGHGSFDLRLSARARYRGATPARPLTPPEIVQSIKQLRFNRLPGE